MFGIGAQEILIIGLLALVVFGPGKLPQMARDLGGFVQKARASMEEFKSEFALEEERNPDRRPAHGRAVTGDGKTAGGGETGGPNAGHVTGEHQGSEENRASREDRQPERASAGASKEATPKR